MILVIDNYDSFTYNLVQLLGNLTQDVAVHRNDQIDLNAIEEMSPDGIVLSPGPGRPEDAGICVGLIRRFSPTIPLLGVCLGHQAVGVAFGAQVVHAPTLMHGRTSQIKHSGAPLFNGVGNPFTATRYHSLVIDRASLPEELVVTAQTTDGVVMAVRHKRYETTGVQFHPESILTDEGTKLLHNWLEVTR
jgi:anthranilate synthase/aminodeoxychorismate synthase-like glutamine amidotransferase